jgi:uncharacterized protein YcnI
MRRRLVSLTVVIAIGVAAIGLSATAASAHVTVQPPTASQGDFVKLSFRVPNETDSADTTQVEVQFPTDHPIASVSVQPKDGWTYKVTTAPLPEPIQTDDGQITEAVTDIVWTGGTIKPGEFDEFSVSAGPLPTDVTSVQFKALQTYSDGTVVRWIDDTPAGGPEPEHPAPTLTLTPATGDASQLSVGETSSDDTTARVLAIVGIVVGIAGVAFGIGAIVASRRKPSAT